MELVLSNGFYELNMDEMELLDGGSTKIAAGVCTIAAGACFIVSGVAAWCGNEKLAAGAGVAGGVCGTAAGVCALFPAP